MTSSAFAQKLALGTVQFGMDYGINNRRGQVPLREVSSILKTAAACGVRVLDTADAYGNAPAILRECVKGDPHWKIHSKFLRDPARTLTEDAHASLKALGTESLECLYFHRYNDFMSHDSPTEREFLREQGVVRSWGVSVYGVDQLRSCLKAGSVDVVQVPFNALDRSSEKRQLMAQAREQGVRIAVRSVFLQGLFFLPHQELEKNFRELVPSVEGLRSLARESGTDLSALLLSYVLGRPYVDHVVIGVDGLEHLEKNLAHAGTVLSPEIIEAIEGLEIAAPALLDPSQWRVERA